MTPRPTGDGPEWKSYIEGIAADAGAAAGAEAARKEIAFVTSQVVQFGRDIAKYRGEDKHRNSDVDTKLDMLLADRNKNIGGQEMLKKIRLWLAVIAIVLTAWVGLKAYEETTKPHVIYFPQAQAPTAKQQQSMDQYAVPQ